MFDNGLLTHLSNLFIINYYFLELFPIIENVFKIVLKITSQIYSQLPIFRDRVNREKYDFKNCSFSKNIDTYYAYSDFNLLQYSQA